MRINWLAIALALMTQTAAARPCNDVYGCVVRAQFCRIEKPETCHYERLLPEQGVGLCTMVMMQVATGWIVGDQAQGKPPHPNFRQGPVSCVTPDEADL